MILLFYEPGLRLPLNGKSCRERANGEREREREREREYIESDSLVREPITWTNVTTFIFRLSEEVKDHFGLNVRQMTAEIFQSILTVHQFCLRIRVYLKIGLMTDGTIMKSAKLYKH